MLLVQPAPWAAIFVQETRVYPQSLNVSLKTWRAKLVRISWCFKINLGQLQVPIRSEVVCQQVSISNVHFVDSYYEYQVQSQVSRKKVQSNLPLLRVILYVKLTDQPSFLFSSSLCMFCCLLYSIHDQEATWACREPYILFWVNICKIRLLFRLAIRD